MKVTVYHLNNKAFQEGLRTLDIDSFAEVALKNENDNKGDIVELDDAKYEVDNFGFRESLRISHINSFAEAALKNGDYNKVISYESSNPFPLNEAYNVTNSIDHYWGDNFHLGGEEGFRSTCVGDIIELDDTKYVVDNFGFNELK